MTSEPDPIAVHVAGVGNVLRGPVRARRSMLAEVREGLCDAAAAYRTAGLDEYAAARRAVADFGPVDLIAAQLQNELTARQARRTALLLVIAFPSMIVGWALVWSGGSGWTGNTSTPVVVMAIALDATSVIVATAGLALLLATFCPVVSLSRVAGAVGVIGTVGALSCAAMAIAMNLANAAATVQLVSTNPAAAPAFVSTAAALALVAHSTGRSLRVTRAG